MKKIISFLFVILLLFSFCGCNKDKHEDANGNDDNAENLNDDNKQELKADSYYNDILSGFNYISGYYSPWRSYVFTSKNNSLINYITEELLDGIIKGKIELCSEEDSLFDPSFSLIGDSKEVKVIFLENETINITFTTILSIVDSIEPITAKYKIKVKEFSKYESLIRFAGLQIDNYVFGDTTCSKYLDCELTEYEQESIIKKYILIVGDLVPSFKYNKKMTGYISGYYGIYNCGYAVMLECYGESYLCVMTNETVNGLTFVYPSSNGIKFMYGSQCYTLTEAFNEKLISENDLQTIYNRYITK